MVIVIPFEEALCPPPDLILRKTCFTVKKQADPAFRTGKGGAEFLL
jgi:hypothetical protein